MDFFLKKEEGFFAAPFTITIPWGKITPRGCTLPNTSHYYCHNITYLLYFLLPFGAAHLCIYALGA